MLTPRRKPHGLNPELVSTSPRRRARRFRPRRIRIRAGLRARSLLAASANYSSVLTRHSLLESPALAIAAASDGIVLAAPFALASYATVARALETALVASQATAPPTFLPNLSTVLSPSLCPATAAFAKPYVRHVETQVCKTSGAHGEETQACGTSDPRPRTGSDAACSIAAAVTRCYSLRRGVADVMEPRDLRLGPASTLTLASAAPTLATASVGPCSQEIAIASSISERKACQKVVQPTRSLSTWGSLGLWTVSCSSVALKLKLK